MEETTTTTTVTIQAFEALINTIIQQDLPVRVRFRTRGDLWYPNFLKVSKESGAGQLHFFDEDRGKDIVLSDVSAVMEFELDNAIQAFDARCLYQIAGDTFFD